MAERLKEKESSIARLQRELEQTLKQQEQLEFANVQYQDKVTSGEQERLTELEQAGILEG